jgi:hypothetical protein
MGELLLAADRAPEANDAVEGALVSARKAFASGHPMRAWFDGVRRAAWISGEPSRLGEAEILIEEAWPAIEAAFGPTSARGSFALQVRLVVCRGLGKSAEADAIERRIGGAK